MAFAARLGPLTGELVEALTSTSAKVDANRFHVYRESALRSLKSHPYLRTNQFEVAKNLDGLEERFRINLKEGLADALRNRLNSLEENPSKWHPEILYLLLEISDQPTYKSNLSDLKALGGFAGEALTKLRWEDIAREDGWDQDAAIWKNTSFSDSSGDEGYGGHDYKSDSDTSLLSSDEYLVGRTAEDLIVRPEDIHLFNAAREAQEWRTAAPPTDSSGNLRKVPVSEFHIVREALFMIQGLDTTLFEKDASVAPDFQISHIEWETHKALVTYFAEAGRQLGILRRFVAQPQAASHLQVFQDSIVTRLRKLDAAVSDIQATLVAPAEVIVVSLLSVKNKLAPVLEPFYVLSSIIAQIQDTPNLGAFRYLELLFDETSVAQLSGRLTVYEFLARIFVECFSIYLRQIRLWMDEGRLVPKDRIFFISESPTRVPPSRIWSDKYMLRRTANGRVHVPNFLHPAAVKIFNAGKNIVVLKQLGKYNSIGSHLKEQEPPLDYETICPEGFELAPFADMFNAAFDRWIQSKYYKTSETLISVLFNDCGLLSSVEALQRVYFMSEGSAAEVFSNDLFFKLDALKPAWRNRYTLSNMAQEGFASLLDTSRLSVSVSVEGQRISLQKARSSVRTALPTININYRLAWAIQMVLSEESIASYHSVFTLLLQLKRALYVLRKKKLLENYWTDDDNWHVRSLYYALRNKLLWFCSTLYTYFATLVLVPLCAKMKHDLEAASDIDTMIDVHAAFIKKLTDEACLGSRLQPIRECMLDVLDLAIRLEQAQSSNAAKEAEEMQELTLLSVSASPVKGTPKRKREVYTKESDDDDDNDEVADNESEIEEAKQKMTLEKPYTTVLGGIQSDLERHLRFICGGLRSVARATSDSTSAKWDILAEMLQTGSGDGR